MFKFAKINVEINKVPKLIQQFSVYFDKLDQNLITKQLYKVYSLQVSMMHGTCVDTKVMSAEPLLVVFKHIISQIGKDGYLKILESTTEDYSIFRSTSSIISTYVFLAEYYLYKKNTEGLEIIYSSYGVYAYTIMFNKRIVYCKPEVFEHALSKMHGLNEFSKNYRKGGHIQVITYFVEAELNKLLRLINANKFNVVVFTRSFSYIKTRINQTLGTFARDYHKLAKESKYDEPEADGITSAQLGMMIKQVINSHKMITQLPETIIRSLNRETDYTEDLAKSFINTEIKLSHTDNDFIEIVSQFYDALFKINYDLIKQVCDVKFLAFLKKIVTSKHANPTIMDLKTKIDKIIKYIIAKSNNPELAQMSTLIKIRKTRILLIRLLFFIYIKNSLCQE